MCKHLYKRCAAKSSLERETSLITELELSATPESEPIPEIEVNPVN